jgi:tetratricopeptide (TPR) repeat protein
MALSGQPTATAKNPRTRLVGREAELAELRAGLIAVRAGTEPRIVTVIGAGGVGKSRLLDEFVAEPTNLGDPKTRVVRGTPTSSTQGFGLFGRWLRARFGISDGMGVQAAESRLAAELRSALGDRRAEDACFYLGQMMGLKFPDSPLTRSAVDDGRQATHLRGALVKTLIEKDAAEAPLLLVFEDLQAADDESVALLGYLFENVAAPLGVVCTARPDFLARHPAFVQSGRARHQLLELGPLSDEQAGEVVRQLVGKCEGGCPDALVQAATRAARGNPGLLEQMVRVYRDSGVLSEVASPGGTPVCKVDLARLAREALPATAADAVAARVAALSPAERRVLECAAAMGSVFWLGGVVALLRQEQATPEFWRIDEQSDVAEAVATLDGLVESDHLLKLPDSAFPGETEYIFKHHVEREQIVAGTNPTVARGYHRTIADWLGQQEATHSHADYCLMLTEQLEKAGDSVNAAHALLEAADITRKHFGAGRAHEYYQRGLALLGFADARRRIDALHNHGDVLVALGKREEALRAFREMLGMAYRLGLHAKGGAAHNRIGRLCRDAGQLKEARQHLDTALGLFEFARDQRGVAACHDDIGRMLWMKGEYEPALGELKTALDIRKTLGDKRSIALSLSNLGRVMLDHGQPGQAREALQAALTLRREIGDPLGTADSLSDLGRLAQDQNDHRQALSFFREAYGIATEVGERSRMAVGLSALGATHDRLGDTEQAIKVLKQAEKLSEELGDKLGLGVAKRSLAKVYLRQGELRPARETIKLAVDLFGQVRSKPHLVAAVRTLGQVAAAGAWGKEHEGKAVEYFMRSITLAKELGNELELAKSYKAFATYVLGSERYQSNSEVQREARKLDAMADEIFGRRRRALGGA